MARTLLTSGESRKLHVTMSTFRTLLVAVVLVAASIGLAAERRPIDARRSTITVRVFKSVVFSAFADNHTIQAPIAGGFVADTTPLGVELTIHAADLRVLDPGLSPSKRAEVQARMTGPEVLDTAKYPEISFTSKAVDAAGADRWMVQGELAIHGQRRAVSVPVVLEKGFYRGSVQIKQRDFGIEPISIAGGTVKVKDQLTIEFEVAAQPG